MPCGDITERIRLIIDSGDRLVSYRFLKKTCGGSIGPETLHQEDIIGQSIDVIVGREERSFQGMGMGGNDIAEFLKGKHINAIQSAIRAFLGLKPKGNSSSCTIARIEYDKNGTFIEAEIKSELEVDKVKACDHCGPH